MSRAYKFHNTDGLYFITFATVGWIDVFSQVTNTHNPSTDLRERGGDIVIFSHDY
ncbi:MAG: hypothetical protein ACO1PI_04100 [Bacteroidota bacterium]